jgi:hypothetical protein
MAEKKTPEVVNATHDEYDADAGVYTVRQEVLAAGSDDEAGARKPSVGLKTAKDGSTVLIPQPSDDPADPLNWSWVKKHSVFLTLLPGCFLTDWVITWGTVLFEQQVSLSQIQMHTKFNSQRPPHGTCLFQMLPIQSLVPSSCKVLVVFSLSRLSNDMDAFQSSFGRSSSP